MDVNKPFVRHCFCVCPELYRWEIWVANTFLDRIAVRWCFGGHMSESHLYHEVPDTQLRLHHTGVFWGGQKLAVLSSLKRDQRSAPKKKLGPPRRNHYNLSCWTPLSNLPFTEVHKQLVSKSGRNIEVSRSILCALFLANCFECVFLSSIPA